MGVDRYGPSLPIFFGICRIHVSVLVVLLQYVLPKVDRFGKPTKRQATICLFVFFHKKVQILCLAGTSYLQCIHNLDLTRSSQHKEQEILIWNVIPPPFSFFLAMTATGSPEQIKLISGVTFIWILIKAGGHSVLAAAAQSSQDGYTSHYLKANEHV